MIKVGNIYKDNLARIVVEKKIGYNYYTCKRWLNGNSTIVSMSKQDFKNKELICNINNNYENSN